MGKRAILAGLVGLLFGAVLELRFPIEAGIVPAPLPVSQAVVTGSRAINTVFQNTSGRPRFVVVTIDRLAGAATVTVFDDSANPPTTVVEAASYAANQVGFLAFFVLPGNYYEVNTQTDVLLSSWIEWS